MARRVVQPPPPRRVQPKRAWAPAPGAAPYPISAALTPNAAGAPGTWSRNPAHHIAVFRPTCGAAGCREPSMVWTRCGVCRAPLGRCHHHEPNEPLATVRVAHQVLHVP